MRETEQRPQDKAEHINRNVNIFLVRHGEQERYSEDDSPLTLNGKRQVRDRFAIRLVDRLKDKGPSVVKVYTSTRRRTKESAEIIQEEVERGITHGILPETRLFTLRERGTLQTTAPINELLDRGHTEQSVFQRWLDEEVLGVTSPLKMAEDTEESIDAMIDFTKRLKPSSEEINFVLVTHETTIGALVKKYFQPIGPARIYHAESIRLTLGNGNKPEFSFRGKTKLRRY
jgi:broad specificity phosphatase PhoE